MDAILGVDLPAYLIATLFHSLVNFDVSCFDALVTPRGHVITVLFVPVAWYLTGLSIRRLAMRRWRAETKEWARGLIMAGGITLVLVGVYLLATAVASSFWERIRDIALALWAFYLAVLAEERLRVWPFNRHSPLNE